MILAVNWMNIRLDLAILETVAGRLFRPDKMWDHFYTVATTLLPSTLLPSSSHSIEVMLHFVRAKKPESCFRSVAAVLNHHLATATLTLPPPPANIFNITMTRTTMIAVALLAAVCTLACADSCFYPYCKYNFCKRKNGVPCGHRGQGVHRSGVQRAQEGGCCQFWAGLPHHRGPQVFLLHSHRVLAPAPPQAGLLSFLLQDLQSR